MPEHNPDARTYKRDMTWELQNEAAEQAGLTYDDERDGELTEWDIENESWEEYRERTGW